MTKKMQEKTLMKMGLGHLHTVLLCLEQDPNKNMSETVGRTKTQEKAIQIEICALLKDTEVVEKRRAKTRRAVPIQSCSQQKAQRSPRKEHRRVRDNKQCCQALGSCL